MSIFEELLEVEALETEEEEVDLCTFTCGVTGVVTTSISETE